MNGLSARGEGPRLFFWFGDLSLQYNSDTSNVGRFLSDVSVFWRRSVTAQINKMLLVEDTSESGLLLADESKLEHSGKITERTFSKSNISI